MSENAYLEVYGEFTEEELERVLARKKMMGWTWREIILKGLGLENKKEVK